MLVQASNSNSKTMNIAELVSAVRRTCNFGLVRFLLAALLIVAAFLKSSNLLAVSVAPWPEFGVVMFELLLAAVMLSSVPAPVAWWLGACCFTALAIVAGHKTLLGYDSCGCFGAVLTPPWIALAIDLLALTALCATHHSKTVPSVEHSQRMVSSWLPSLRAVGMACVLLLALKSSWITVADNGKRSIDPHQWQNARLPLLDSIDIGEQLAKGEWLVVFHRPGCKACETFIREISKTRSSDQFSKAQAVLPIAMINLENESVAPKLDPEKQPTVIQSTHGTLLRSVSGWLPTPIILLLRNGVVVNLAVEPDELHLVAFLEKDYE